MTGRLSNLERNIWAFIEQPSKGRTDMNTMLEKVKASSEKGNLCSQIVVDVGLEYFGLQKPDLVTGAGGLAGAQGFLGVTCGALTAAGLLISSVATGKMDQDLIYMLIQELEDRFNEELVNSYPGNRCDDILEAEPEKLPTDVCPPVIAGVIRIALELLEEKGLVPG